jgi:hypothetical protein
MTPKEYEGKEYEQEQYEDSGLPQHTLIDFEHTSGELVAVGGAVRSEDGETAAGHGATGVVTVPQDEPSESPKPPESIPAGVWEALVRNYGQAAWVGASVYEARQSGKSPPLQDDFLNLWDGELERSGVYELRD